MPIIWALLTLALHLWPGAIVRTHGQGTRQDDTAFNSRGNPLAGATVRVCTMPVSGQPYTSRALIYSDAALTQAIANPTITDGLGNYFFYPAPGKYENEVSGPSITTKQLPKIFLPNDPSSRTFGGAISAFSRSLSGNLSVTGNATVIGSLANGTLNLHNQSLPRCAASADTVNPYTKSSDNRLYYKNETGTEIGPITSASGAQTNIINTFTAAQNVDSDVQTKGPNPYFSASRYGGYSSTTNSPPSTTGTISFGSSTLRLASAQDFANGQGIVVYKAGAATTLAQPGTPTVTPTNFINGSTTYSYRAVAEDRTGGLTAAGAAGSTTTGAATLGLNSIALAQCSRTSGTTTYTSRSAHNLQAGTQVNITGFGGNDNCNGVKTIATTPTSTTFTLKDGAVANTTNTSGSPTAQVYACNVLTFPRRSFSGNSTIHYWIYRNGALSGVAQGVDPWFMDCGQPAPNAPAYVPRSPHGAAQAGYLATTIVSGGGTTTLALADAASTSARSQTVLHDNSPNLKAAYLAACLTGGTVYIPNGGSGTPYWVFNSTLDFGAGSGSCGVNITRIHSNSGQVWVNQPWITRFGMDFEGEPHASTSFSYVNGSQMIAVNAYPMFLLPEGQGSVHFSRMQLLAYQSGQSAVIMDEGADGGGVAGITFDDVNFQTSGNATPVVIKGGFDFFFNRGVCNGGNGSRFVPWSCLQMTNASSAVTGATLGQVGGRLKAKGLYFSGGTAIELDCQPAPGGVAVLDMSYDTTIFEGATAPYLRINCPAGVFGTFVFNDVVTADSTVGAGTPTIDAQNGSVSGILWTGGLFFNANSPVLIGSGFSDILLNNAPTNNPGNTNFTAGSGNGLFSSVVIASFGNGKLQYSMPGPTAGPGAIVSAGGSLPIGTLEYQINFVDIDGNFTGLSPVTTATTSGGSRTVTVTYPRPAPDGAVAWIPYRNGGMANIPGCGNIPLSTPSFVDTFGFICGTSAPFSTTAGSSIFGKNGISTSTLRLTNNGFVVGAAFPNNLSGNRTLSIPDNTGYLPTTSYLNSAYDNATRANGAIGANWTVTNNGINIASNNFVGTAATNDVAFWSASPFSPVQFSQVTLTALNGTTDFPGVTVLMSGSGGSTQGYNCIENSTNIFIQKIAGTTNTILKSASTTGAVGDILRLEAAPGGALTCYKNGVSTLAITDTTYSSGNPGLFLFGTVATAKNWSGGNLHPLSQLDVEQDWTKGQHLVGNYATCSMSAGTSCTVTLSASSQWKACNAQVQGTSAIAAACSISGTMLTVTAATSNSQTWGIFLY